VDEEKILKGKSVEAIKAACLYIACKEHKSTRTFKEICNLTKVSKKEIGRCYKILQPHLLEPQKAMSFDSYVYRFCSQLDMGQDIVRGALRVCLINQLCEKVQDKGLLAGRSPITVVAACLYFVSCLSANPVSAKSIADTAQCTESTLKSGYKILYEDREDLAKDLNMRNDITHLPV
jgi:transcription initiation factor TFIIB